MATSLLHALGAAFFFLLACCAGGAVAQTNESDWKEATPASAPAFNPQRLIALDVPRSSLRFGVDPETVTLGADGVVRYVVVASSSAGAVNAMYEGIRCVSGQYKVYARHNPDSGWVPVAEPTWRSLYEEAQRGQRHSLLIARTGACLGQGPNRSAQQIVRDLRSPVDWRFATEGRP